MYISMENTAVKKQKNRFDNPQETAVKIGFLLQSNKSTLEKMRGLKKIGLTQAEATEILKAGPLVYFK